MSTSNTHQPSLADVRSKTCPQCLIGEVTYHGKVNSDDILTESGRHEGFLTIRLIKVHMCGDSTKCKRTPRPETKDDLTRDALKQYEADIEVMNLILISILNDIYNSETRFNNEFDQFIAEPKESLVVRLARKLIEVSYDDLFDYIQQYEKIVIDFIEKKLEKTHDPLALVFSNPTNNRLRSSLNIRNQAVVQADKANIQTKIAGNDGRTAESSNVQKETGNLQINLRTTSSGNDSKYFMEQMLLAKKDEARVILSNEQYDFLLTDTLQMEEFKELSANICIMARIQPAHIDSDKGPSYIFAFISELEQYKEKVRVFETYTATKTNFQTKFIEADLKAKRLETDLQNQFIRDRDKIRALKQEINELKLKVSEQRKQILELQNAQSVLKRKMNDDEDNLGYENPNTLKKAIAHNPMLYDASCLNNSKMHVNVYDTEEILKDTTQSQIKMENKLKDPIAIEKKQNFHSIDYKKLKTLYEMFVPQKELSAEQKYFPHNYLHIPHMYGCPKSDHLGFWCFKNRSENFSPSGLLMYVWYFVFFLLLCGLFLEQ
ncbi:hypothetical protein Tco_0923422 [Tanacetum coccineum]|uniref:Uncharacterized protein n=1 Tax=Tanacetum coccineum TaxID=301880 RepID=A0ABQ5D3C7_9ASTR